MRRPTSAGPLPADVHRVSGPTARWIAWTLFVVSSAFVIPSLAIIAATDTAVAFLGSRAAFVVFGLGFLGRTASTLASFALLQPIRRRVQVAVDRRSSRARYNSTRPRDDFANRRSHEVDGDALRSDLLDAVHETMARAHASRWLRERAP